MAKKKGTAKPAKFQNYNPGPSRAKDWLKNHETQKNNNKEIGVDSSNLSGHQKPRLGEDLWEMAQVFYAAIGDISQP